MTALEVKPSVNARPNQTPQRRNETALFNNPALASLFPELDSDTPQTRSGPPSWIESGSCYKDKNIVVFYPTISLFDRPNRSTSEAHAKAICAGCPVFERCKTYAITSTDILSGVVWGGMSQDELEAARAKLRPEGVKFATWRLLNLASESSFSELSQLNQELLSQYFFTDASLADLATKFSLDKKSINGRLKRSLKKLWDNADDETKTHFKEADVVALKDPYTSARRRKIGESQAERLADPFVREQLRETLINSERVQRNMATLNERKRGKKFTKKKVSNAA